MARPKLRTFEFLECLGCGGFGEVYRARMVDGSSIECVAVKLLHPGAAKQHQAMERLRDEARILGLLEHPVVPKAWGVTELAGQSAMIVEFIDGVDLHQMRRIGPRPCMLVLERVASALHSAFVTVVDGEPLHVVHRDVKPANIRLSVRGEVKLLDFGIAHMDASDREALTVTGDVLGSVPFLAPERMLDGATGPEQDVFALGATIFEAMFDRRLLASTMNRVYNILADEESFGETLDERFEEVDAPPPVEALLRRMVAYNPADRPDAHAIACEAHRIAAVLEGPDLQELAAVFPFDERALTPGHLSGKRLEETGRTTFITRPDVMPRTVLRNPDSLQQELLATRPLPTMETQPTAPMSPFLMGAGVFAFVCFLLLLGTTVFVVVFAAL